MNIQIYGRRKRKMAKKICVIKTSLRYNSNSDQLADAFIQGAKESGNSIEEISLKDKDIAFCKGCLACLKSGECVIRDGANSITEQIKQADVIVWATPIYYYEMSGQMKVMIDRANSLYETDYQFRDVYLLSTAAENEDGVDHRAINGLKGWVACYPKSHFVGSVFAGGVDGSNTIKDHPALKKAYEIGKAIQ
jgi:multimeric flavodoxin WrbA